MKVVEGGDPVRKRSAVLAMGLVTALATVGIGSGCGSASPSTEPDVRAKEVTDLFREGVNQFNEGKIDAAIATLQKGREIQPDYTLLRYDLGRMLNVRGERNQNEAFRVFEKMEEAKRERKPEEADQRLAEGHALWKAAQRDFAEARDQFLYVYDRWPHEKANVAYFLMVAFTGLGNYREARDYLDVAIDAGQPTGDDLKRLMEAHRRLDDAIVTSERLDETPWKTQPTMPILDY